MAHSFQFSGFCFTRNILNTYVGRKTKGYFASLLFTRFYVLFKFFLILKRSIFIFQHVQVPSYSDLEYQQHLHDENWTREETDHLFDLCERFDLRYDKSLNFDDDLE